MQLPTLDEARALGETLRAIDPSMLKPTPHKRRWYRGGEPYLEATLDEDDDGVLMLEVYMRGRFARFTRQRGVETGVTEELAITTAAPSSKIEAHDAETKEQVLDVVRAMLEANDELKSFASLLT
jgi:hypothetical protein